MKIQFRPNGGKSFWDLSDVCWENLKCGNPPGKNSIWFVNWNSRTWLCKYKDESICEVVGYQIAEALGVPLQPWVAFFQNQKDNQTPKSMVGILIEKWPQFELQATLAYPTQTHPDLVGCALAFAILDRNEWPEWMMDKDMSNLRLFDLERTGPRLCWPPQTTRAIDYAGNIDSLFNSIRKQAKKSGVLELFLKYLEEIKALDFSSILDFSGHPHASTIKTAIIRGLEARQRKLRRL